MKKVFVLLTLSLALVGSSSMAALPQEVRTGSARLNSINGSEIEARIVFLDTGPPLNELIVAGRARGLDPTQSYVTLVYDAGSVAEGPAACTPSGIVPPLTPDQMFVGSWEVSENGTGELFAVKTGSSYVPLRAVGTTSVRVVLGPPPEGFVLQACGEVEVRRNR
jgi:hypothetical protein